MSALLIGSRISLRDRMPRRLLPESQVVLLRQMEHPLAQDFVGSLPRRKKHLDRSEVSCGSSDYQITIGLVWFLAPKNRRQLWDFLIVAQVHFNKRGYLLDLLLEGSSIVDRPSIDVIIYPNTQERISVSSQETQHTSSGEVRSDTPNRITDFSQHPAAKALDRFIHNPRVSRIRLIVPHDACPTCRHLEGEYDKDNVPELPLLSCSHPLGCRSFYEPMLTEIYP